MSMKSVLAEELGR